MNLLNIIREKSHMLPPGFKRPGLEAVILHIERAEAYWEKAKKESDDILFTDVIYRTNQAFEGILKEAYFSLAGKDASRIPPHKIEDYLAKSNLFRERVLTAFTHYRTEWRNEAAHDYKLFFTEQEALLAINSVSTFCIILLDQILTKANEAYERERSRQFSATVKNSIKGYTSLHLHQKISALLLRSYSFLDVPKSRFVSENEYIGLLSGFIEAVDSTIKVESDVLFDSQSRERADLVFSRGKDNVIAKIKRFTPVRELGQAAYRQLLHELECTGIQFGILMTIDEKATCGDSRILKNSAENSPVITFINPTKADTQHTIKTNNVEPIRENLKSLNLNCPPNRQATME